MNSEEQTLIDGLFTRLKQAEAGSAPRDAQAYERIKEHVAAQPAVPYYMAQAILVQEAALKRMDEQVKKLQADLAQARAQAGSGNQQPASGGFLSNLFGGGSRPEPAPAPQQSGGWREPGNGYQQPAPQQPQYAPPPQQAAPAGGGFMRGALQTAAGVAGGVMLAEGISSLFHHNSQPQEIVEILQEPAPAQDQGGWGNEPERFANNDSWGNESGNLTDTDFSDDSGGSFFDDDDTFV
ncbi:DUF2076 domain-containing protein [Pseudomonas eucalypticola]|uniref:DUF2076 domain-containing protein n=1 Tax=Pseudomonas eucalypticola TaxID=2599595 RepID=A0A7D5DAW4_9PSED|nr:DUF2076 domain-containing protein [Pseudomonas eucalypticola]QKZ06896.1 DUF2076 domain-containing protein [Pseudomonas eucalypticola]